MNNNSALTQNFGKSYVPMPARCNSAPKSGPIFAQCFSKQLVVGNRAEKDAKVSVAF
jgi:hypothetical protein